MAYCIIFSQYSSPVPQMVTVHEVAPYQLMVNI